MKDAIIIYFSNTGNTKKVAKTVYEGLKEKEVNVTIKEVAEAYELDLLDYDLVCIGAPSYNWMPPKDMQKFLEDKFDKYEQEGYVKLKAPKVEGRNALVFCTYSGPHTGKNEAIPVVKYIGQFFEHLGFEILDEWYILSEMVGSKKYSTQGKMGDIRGLPDEQDLKIIKEKTKKLVSKL
ncbi:MAG TPA: flavodoxin domain-containing protein [Halanaerobiales bacterium]|nr:flavodoxin domain-containing protein [Halanaerobiales bacterium]